MQQPFQGLKAMAPVKSFGDLDGGLVAEKLTRTMVADSPQQLVELFSDEVWRFTSSQVPRREDAEDIAMEVFAVAFASFAKLSRVENQRLWLLTVARRKVADFLRQKYRRAEQPLSESHPLDAPGQIAEITQAVRSGIRDLPQEQGEALVLKYVNGLSTEEVSRVIRKSVPATNSLLQRARAAFREAVGPAIADYAGSMS